MSFYNLSCYFETHKKHKTKTNKKAPQPQNSNNITVHHTFILSIVNSHGKKNPWYLIFTTANHVCLMLESS